MLYSRTTALKKCFPAKLCSHFILCTLCIDYLPLDYAPAPAEYVFRILNCGKKESFNKEMAKTQQFN